MLVAVIGGHVLLLALLVRFGIQRAPERQPERTLLLVELMRELPPPAESETPAAPRDVSSPRARQRSKPAVSPDTAITPPLSQPPAPRIDWTLEAERAARDAAAAREQPGPRAFGEQPVSPYRRCKPRESSFEWDPEPDKAGFAGGLPFVRLGERCIVGLGFFGCAIGKLPEANGELFADMHSAREPESSVPDLDECPP
ncbi:MAG TPA: hypothetical protein VFR59_05825 [Steroidobacteraceae bacterium]|nr:hypothetical protein [Steroidobacteraceae bacterium]